MNSDPTEQPGDAKDLSNQQQQGEIAEQVPCFNPILYEQRKQKLKELFLQIIKEMDEDEKYQDTDAHVFIDVGCGAGEVMRYIANDNIGDKKRCFFFGIDRNPEELRKGPERITLQYSRSKKPIMVGFFEADVCEMFDFVTKRQDPVEDEHEVQDSLPNYFGETENNPNNDEDAEKSQQNGEKELKDAESQEQSEPDLSTNTNELQSQDPKDIGFWQRACFCNTNEKNIIENTLLFNPEKPTQSLRVSAYQLEDYSEIVPISSLYDSDIVILSEVIEHIYPNQVLQMEKSLFFEMSPKYVIVSTPARDFNNYFLLLSQGSTANYDKFIRNEDHKFEWTEQEFRDWAKHVCDTYPQYSIYCETSVGSKQNFLESVETTPEIMKLLQEEAKTNNSAATQFIVFKRNDNFENKKDELPENDTVAATNVGNEEKNENSIPTWFNFERENDCQTFLMLDCPLFYKYLF